MDVLPQHRGNGRLPDEIDGQGWGSTTGNALVMSETDVNSPTPSEREALNQAVAAQLFEAGTHCVIDGVWHLLGALDSIESRIAHREHP